MKIRKIEILKNGGKNIVDDDIDLEPDETFDDYCYFEFDDYRDDPGNVVELIIQQLDCFGKVIIEQWGYVGR